VEAYSQFIYFPVRLAKADDFHSHKGYSFADVTTAMLQPGSAWCEGNAPLLAPPLPGILAAPGHPPTEWRDWQHLQAHAYFHPSIRQFLFDTRPYPNDYRLAFHRNDVTSLEVKLNLRDEHEQLVRLSVLRCEIEVFRMGTAILVIELASQGVLNLRQTQAIQNQLRRCYVPYFDGFENKHEQVEPTYGRQYPLGVRLFRDDVCLDIGSEIGVQFDAQFKARFFGMPPSPHKTLMPDSIALAAHWNFLLAPLLTHPARDAVGLRFMPLGDDRLPILSYIALDQIHQVSEGDWARICFADNPGDDQLPYAKQFLESFERDYCYDRYWYRSGESTDMPSRILSSGYAFAWVGSAKDKDYFTDARNGAYPIFRQVYSRVALMAHMQKAALQSVSMRLAELSQRDYAQCTPPDYFELASKVDIFYREFIEFTQVYWFDEVSPQLQGIELFTQWQKHLRSRALFDEVRQELQDLTSLVNMQEQKMQTESTKRLSWYAVAFGLVSLVAAFWTIDLKAPAPKATTAPNGGADLTAIPNPPTLVENLKVLNIGGWFPDSISAFPLFSVALGLSIFAMGWGIRHLGQSFARDWKAWRRFRASEKRKRCPSPAKP
jgi:hypothetical protein